MKNFYYFDEKLNLKKGKEGFYLQVKKPKKKSYKNQLEFISEIGYYIITPIIIGVFIGLYLDNYFKTKQIFFVTLLFFGMMVSFYNLYRIYKEFIKNGR